MGMAIDPAQTLPDLSMKSLFAANCRRLAGWPFQGQENGCREKIRDGIHKKGHRGCHQCDKTTGYGASRGLGHGIALLESGVRLSQQGSGDQLREEALIRGVTGQSQGSKGEHQDHQRRNRDSARQRRHAHAREDQATAEVSADEYRSSGEPVNPDSGNEPEK